MKTAIRIASALCIGALAACGGGGTAPSASPVPSSESPTPTATATSASPSVTATPTPTPTPSASTASATPTTASPSGRSSTCAPLGARADQVHSTPGNLSTLTGREMRVGQHPCFERYVFEMQGTGEEPFWRVGYRDPLIADPSGQTVALRGGADLEIVVGVWTVVPGAGMPPDQLPFVGSREIFTSGYTAIQEALVVSSFEGMTQIGLGIDTERPFKVTYLTGPPRLVVDVSTS